jgi:predicted nucleic acid-binding protein
LGTLGLPTAGPVAVDAQIVIYSVEKHPVFGPLVRPLWEAVQKSQLEVVCSELTILEVLVGPLKRGDGPMVVNFENFFQLPGITAIPISGGILRAAAQLRATVPKLRTPDAIHAATAQAAGCTTFLTNDFAFRAVGGLPVVILQDALATP